MRSDASQLAPNPPRRFRFSAAAPLLMAALAIPAGADSGIIPWKAEPGKAFDLMITNSVYTCATGFTHLSVALRSDSLVLSFLAKDDPGVRCAAPSQPMGPEFPIPALKAGSYRVFARSLFPCMVEGPAICLMESMPYFVDTLKVAAGNAFAPGWFLRPGRIEAGKSVTVALLSRDHGSCEFGFSKNTSQVTKEGDLYLTFETHGYKRLCEQSVRPFGPIFPLEGLKPGRYPVYAASAPGCTFEKPPCLLPIQYERVDTLIVTASTGLGEIPGPSRALGGKTPAGRRRPAAVPTFGRDGLPWVVTPEGRRVAPANAP